MKVRNKSRSARRARLRRALFDVLGGRCSTCQGVDELEIHHVDGCTWNQRERNAEHRLYTYLRELRSGVRLDVLCRSCNGALNQSTYGTRAERGAEEVPF